MNQRRFHALVLAIVTVATALTVLASPAQAATDYCGEFGIWASGTFGAYTYASKAQTDVDVSNIPPAATCIDGVGVSHPNNGATQHSSLHMLYPGTNSCVEVVAQRHTDGHMTIWGYNCGYDSNLSPSAGVNDPAQVNFDIYNYAASSMQLMTYAPGNVNGPAYETNWASWITRRDTGQQIYVSTVSRLRTRLQPHAESSGYNYNSIRRTAFTNFVASNEYTNLTPVKVPCRPGDGRQIMQSGLAAGTARFGAVGSFATC